MLFPNLYDKFVYHQFDLNDTTNFMNHLKVTHTALVIDVSCADTVEMLNCCNELEIKYVNSALESTMVDENEEVYMLCQSYEMESGFLYKVNDHTTELIRANLDHVDALWDCEMKVLDPLEAPLEGEDLIGVLLVYPEKEAYMYNVMNNDCIFNEYKTNATYFQVACGIYAAVSVLLLDSIPNGVYYVNELLVKTNNQYGKYLAYYMTDFVTGENHQSDGLLLQRMRKVPRTHT